MDPITVDAKFTLVEQQYGHHLTPEELYRKIPDFAPQASRLLEETPYEGCWRIAPEHLSSLPELDWDQLYNLV